MADRAATDAAPGPNPMAARAAPSATGVRRVAPARVVMIAAAGRAPARAVTTATGVRRVAPDRAVMIAAAALAPARVATRAGAGAKEFQSARRAAIARPGAGRRAR
jgi:hypothetical protein